MSDSASADLSPRRRTTSSLPGSGRHSEHQPRASGHPQRSSRSLLLALATAAAASACGDSGSSTARLLINELVVSNGEGGCADEAGETDDWIELFNAGEEAIDLGGFSITDDVTDPKKKTFGKGLVIQPGGVLVLWADGDSDQGAAHLPFKLKAQGERLQLFDPGQALVDEYEWTDASEGAGFARFPDGGGELVSCLAPTCGALNGSACAQQ